MYRYNKVYYNDLKKLDFFFFLHLNVDYFIIIFCLIDFSEEINLSEDLGY